MSCRDLTSWQSTRIIDSPNSGFQWPLLLKEVNPRLVKRPLKTSGHLANLELTSLVKEATGGMKMTLTHWGRVMHICVTNLDHNLCCIIVDWTLRNNLQSNYIQNSNIFIQENSVEIVICEIAAILSRPQCVKPNQSISQSINQYIFHYRCTKWDKIWIARRWYCWCRLVTKSAQEAS